MKTVTFGYGQVANSYIPAGALYHYQDNLRRPYDPQKAKAMLKAAGAADLKLNYGSMPGMKSMSKLPFCYNSSWQKPG